MNHCRNIAEIIAANLKEPTDSIDLYLTTTNAHTGT